MATAFDAPGRWYRGVTHAHTTGSDGRWPPEQVIAWYRDHGYDFCAITDHLVHTNTVALSTPTFLTMPGVEMHGYDAQIERTPHVVGLGIDMEGRVEPGTSMQQIIDLILERGGIPIVAHPYWSALRDRHLAHVRGYAGIEIYNHTCWEHVGKGDSLTHWDNLLYDGRQVWGLAVDDAHCPPSAPDIGGGWIMVKASELSTEAMLSAIRAGQFYASQGPDIADWQVTTTETHVRCSPVERIQIHGPAGFGRVQIAPQGETIQQATFALPQQPSYLRVTCIDHSGKRAWTNPVFQDRSRAWQV